MVRYLTSRHPDLPSGFVQGQATLMSQRGTSELIYTEEGVFEATDVPTRSITKSYIWSNDDKGISVNFDNGDKPKTLFHTLIFHKESLCSAIIANTMPHKCGSDIYKSNYSFKKDNNDRLVKWTVEHIVNGPFKNYDSITTFSRC